MPHAILPNAAPRTTDILAMNDVCRANGFPARDTESLRDMVFAMSPPYRHTFFALQAVQLLAENKAISDMPAARDMIEDMETALHALEAYPDDVSAGLSCLVEAQNKEHAVCGNTDQHVTTLLQWFHEDMPTSVSASTPASQPSTTPSTPHM